MCHKKQFKACVPPKAPFSIAHAPVSLETVTCTSPQRGREVEADLKDDVIALHRLCGHGALPSQSLQLDNV